MIVLEIAAVAAAIAVAFFVTRRLIRQVQRRRLREAPFPQAWREIIEANVPLYGRMPEPLREQLHGLVQVFVAEKHFEGCGGLEMTDEMWNEMLNVDLTGVMRTGVGTGWP